MSVKEIKFGWNEDVVNPVTLCTITFSGDVKVDIAGAEADELQYIIENYVENVINKSKKNLNKMV